MLPALVLVLAQPREVIVSRHAPSDGSVVFSPVQDTFLDSTQPNENYGRDALLSGGPGKVILIQFGDLRRAVGESMRVSSARLVFRQILGGPPQLSSVARVLSPWTEGAGNRDRLIRRAPVGPDGPDWAATWRFRRAGVTKLGWDRPGASGNDDRAVITAAKGEAREGVFVVEGLASAVQAMLDRPYEAHGLALQFAGVVDFASSDAATDAPRLVLTVEPAPARTGPDLAIDQVRPTASGWEVVVRNRGGAASGGYRVGAWFAERRRSSSGQQAPLGADETRTVAVEGQVESDRPDRERPIVFVIESTTEDVNPANDGMTVYAGARAVKLSVAPGKVDPGAAIARWNEEIAPFSRFSFAPEGVLSRVNLSEAEVIASGASSEAEAFRQIRSQLDLPEFPTTVPEPWKGRLGSPSYPPQTGLSGWGDTRDETRAPGLYSIPYGPWFDPVLSEFRLEAGRRLNATEVAILSAGSEGIERYRPESILLTLADSAASPIGEADLAFFDLTAGPSAQPAFTAKTGRAGAAVLRGDQLGDLTRTWAVRASKAGVDDWLWLPGWQVIDATARGGRRSAIVSVRANLPSGPLEVADAAEAKAVTDSAGRLPAQLVGLVDGRPDTAVELAAAGRNSWVEIDLGRDRLVGAVELDVVGQGIWSAFQVVGYGTGQRPIDALLFAAERDGPWTLTQRGQAQGQVTRLVYCGRAQRARHIRFIATEPGPPMRVARIGIRLIASGP